MVANDGTFEKTVGTGATTISAAFSDTGTSGNLAMSRLRPVRSICRRRRRRVASYSGAGAIDFGGGTRTLDANSSITTSNVDFGGGATTLNGGTYNAYKHDSKRRRYGRPEDRDS